MMARPDPAWLRRRQVHVAAVVLLLGALYGAGALRLGTLRWDGFAPGPYRYVSPPPGVANGGPPERASGTITFTNGVSNETQIYTADLQAQVLIPSGVFPPDSAGHPVMLSIVPKAPPPVPPLFAYGNGYVITATYVNGGPVPEPWKQPIQVYLLFPSNVIPTGLYRLDNDQPTKIGATVDIASMSVQGASNRGGTYFTAGTRNPLAAQQAAQRSRTVLVASAAIILIGIALLLVGGRRLLRARR